MKLSKMQVVRIAVDGTQKAVKDLVCMRIPAAERKGLGFKANYRAVWCDPTTDEMCSALVRLVVIDGDVVNRMMNEMKREDTLFKRYIGSVDCSGKAGRHYQYLIFCSFKKEEMSIAKTEVIEVDDPSC